MYFCVVYFAAAACLCCLPWLSLQLLLADQSTRVLSILFYSISEWMGTVGQYLSIARMRTSETVREREFVCDGRD